jgi:hypothetical protein
MSFVKQVQARTALNRIMTASRVVVLGLGARTQVRLESRFLVTRLGGSGLGLGLGLASW